MKALNWTNKKSISVSTNYTAPSNGVFYIAKVGISNSTSGYYATLKTYINNSMIALFRGNDVYYDISYPVSSGDVLKWEGSDYGTEYYVYFVPYK